MFFRRNNLLIKHINNALIELPAPCNLNYWWNFGSLLGLCLVIQIVTGVILACHYNPSVELAFNSVQHIVRNVNYGWAFRATHANGASAFFICVYIHIARGIYYGSFHRKAVWNVGVILLLLMMAIAFIGYVLPWGQMSFWGATVITNFISAIPYVGETIVQWVWGGFSVGGPTLTRFYSLHYLFPFILVAMVLVHIIYLHEKGSNNPLGINSNIEKVPFHPYYTTKDLFGVFVFASLFMSLVMFYPNMLGEPENFIKANSLVTPVHIMPEWYFLFAYAILRAIPNKLGGVIALVLSILILLVLPYTATSNEVSMQFRPLSQIFFWGFVGVFLSLSYLGMKPVEHNFIVQSQIFAVLFFAYFLVIVPLVGSIENAISNWIPEHTPEEAREARESLNKEYARLWAKAKELVSRAVKLCKETGGKAGVLPKELAGLSLEALMELAGKAGITAQEASKKAGGKTEPENPTEPSAEPKKPSTAKFLLSDEKEIEKAHQELGEWLQRKWHELKELGKEEKTEPGKPSEPEKLTEPEKPSEPKKPSEAEKPGTQKTEPEVLCNAVNISELRHWLHHYTFTVKQLKARAGKPVTLSLAERHSIRAIAVAYMNSWAENKPCQCCELVPRKTVYWVNEQGKVIIQEEKPARAHLLMAEASQKFGWGWKGMASVFPIPAAANAEVLFEFHHFIMIFIMTILGFVAWWMFRILRVYTKREGKTYYNRNFAEFELVELVWTIIPVFIVVTIAVPSLSILYGMEQLIEPTMTVKAIGHQWNWEYEYSPVSGAEERASFVSSMIPTEELTLGQLRLLEVDNRLLLPVHEKIRVMITGSDVIHAWTVPAIGVKVDAVPGHLNQISFCPTRTGTFYGQCSEICGTGHAFMPIVVEVVNKQSFVFWFTQLFK